MRAGQGTGPGRASAQVGHISQRLHPRRVGGENVMTTASPNAPHTWQDRLERAFNSADPFIRTAADVSEDDRVFHYTSTEGALGILHSRRLWLTDAAYTADVRELEYAVSICDEAFDNVRKQATDARSARLLDDVQDSIEHFHLNYRGWCIGCFSSRGIASEPMARLLSERRLFPWILGQEAQG